MDVALFPYVIEERLQLVRAPVPCVNLIIIRVDFCDDLFVRLSIQSKSRIEVGMEHVVVIEMWRYPYTSKRPDYNLAEISE